MIRVLCTSHSPLLLSVAPREKRLADEFFAAIEQAHRRIVDYDPEVIVLFGPDHFNGFFYNVMPSFCVGTHASSSVDWGIEAGKLDVPEALARDLLASVRAADIDLAVSYRMTVDHGFTIPLNLLVKRLDRYPTIPVFINCNAPPLPSCRRVRLLGDAVGRFLDKTGLRVLVIGSGGLSHDPPHAPYEQAAPDIREVLVAARPRRAEEEIARQDRVKSGTLELTMGRGPCLPPDRAWDRAFLDLLLSQQLTEVDQFADDWIRRVGGSGGHEIRTWIAAFAALGSTGKYRAKELHYDIVADWATGMAVMEGLN